MLPLTGAGPSANWIIPTDISNAQGMALKALYDATGGLYWTNNTNWGKTETANDWFGVTVAGGVVTVLSLPTNNLVGNVSSWAISDLSNMTTLVIRANSITGDISGWTVTAAMRFFHIYSTQLSGSPIMTSSVAMDQYFFHACSLSQANVDAICLAVYNRRAAFTDAAPALNIGGTNSTPSGIYQDGDPPTTGKEYIFEIENDPEIEGFNTWTVTYTL